MNNIPYEFYTYKNLHLDPATCVCPVDDYLPVSETTNPSIETLISAFYASFFKDHGSHQLYIYRSLDGVAGLGCCSLYWDSTGSPTNVRCMSINNMDKEKEVMLDTVTALKETIDPLTGTGIFVEVKPGVWSIVHEKA